MELESKKASESEAEGAQGDEKPRWKQHMEKHSGVLTTAATGAVPQLFENEFHQIPAKEPSEESVDHSFIYTSGTREIRTSTCAPTESSSSTVSGLLS